MCILGGGFGGLYTAVKLESLMWPKGNKPKVSSMGVGERAGVGYASLSSHRTHLAGPAAGAGPSITRLPACLHAAQVTLIDQSDRFVFKPLLYELVSGAASEEEVAPSFSRLLAPFPITFLQGKVAAVQPEAVREVRGWARAVGTVCMRWGWLERRLGRLQVCTCLHLL